MVGILHPVKNTYTAIRTKQDDTYRTKAWTTSQSRGLHRPAVAAAGCIPRAMGRGGCKYLQEHGYGCGHGCELVTDFSKINSETKIALCPVKEKIWTKWFPKQQNFLA